MNWYYITWTWKINISTAYMLIREALFVHSVLGRKRIIGFPAWLVLSFETEQWSMLWSFKENVNDTFKNRYIFLGRNFRREFVVAFHINSLNMLSVWMTVYRGNSIKAIATSYKYAIFRSVESSMYFEQQ